MLKKTFNSVKKTLFFVFIMKIRVFLKNHKNILKIILCPS